MAKARNPQKDVRHTQGFCTKFHGLSPLKMPTKMPVGRWVHKILCTSTPASPSSFAFPLPLLQVVPPNDLVAHPYRKAFPRRNGRGKRVVSKGAKEARGGGGGRRQFSSYFVGKEGMEAPFLECDAVVVRYICSKLPSLLWVR